MQINLNFERFQTNSTGVKKLLLISSSSHIYNTSKALRLCKTFDPLHPKGFPIDE